MAVVTITYEAKCKHCAHFEQGTRRIKSICRKGDPTNIHPKGGMVTAKSSACDDFKL